MVFPATPPGLIVQLPAGSPFNTTLPVLFEHVGCVMVPATGAEGVTGWVFIVTVEDGAEVHPTEFVTVKTYVPAERPEMVLLEPEPVIAPGSIVQLPEGRPVKVTLPVAVEQVGCTMVLTLGALGVSGWGLITTLADAGDAHPTEFVTVKL